MKDKITEIKVMDIFKNADQGKRVEIILGILLRLMEGK